MLVRGRGAGIDAGRVPPGVATQVPGGRGRGPRVGGPSYARPVTSPTPAPTTRTATAPAGPPRASPVPDGGGTVVGPDGLARPAWAATDPLLREYYDTEWGMPVRDERGMFERLSLEAFQSGLSWVTILRKRPAFRAAFDDFEPDVVARYTDDDVARLLADAGIVRNRAKVLATVTNARATVDLRADGGLVDLVWSFRPDRTPEPAHARRGADELAGVGRAGPRAAPAGLRLRRADDDVRAHGGGRGGGHPPRRQPPARDSGVWD